MIDEHQPVSISGSNPPKYLERNFVFLLREGATETAEYSQSLIFNVPNIKVKSNFSERTTDSLRDDGQMYF